MLSRRGIGSGAFCGSVEQFVWFVGEFYCYYFYLWFFLQPADACPMDLGVGTDAIVPTDYVLVTISTARVPPDVCSLSTNMQRMARNVNYT